MLSVFPELLFLSPFATMLLRCAVGFVFAYAAWHHIQRTDISSRTVAIPEFAVAALFFAGIWIQAAALAGLIIGAIWFFQPSSRVIALGTILLSLVMCLALLIMVADPFAFDLPL